jgi:hypothetical protein
MRIRDLLLALNEHLKYGYYCTCFIEKVQHKEEKMRERQPAIYIMANSRKGTLSYVLTKRYVEARSHWIALSLRSSQRRALSIVGIYTEIYA